MRIALFFTFCLAFQWLFSQTVVEKTIIDSRINFIEIDATNCFDIILETIDGNQMQIAAKIDGEYHKDLLLNVNEQGSTLQVSTDFQPNFSAPNDKLGAHKVISVALRIGLPHYKSVQINGTNCNVSAKGKYVDLSVSLSDGQCTLEGVSEQAVVRTQSGDIVIKSNQAAIQAESKYGVVDENTIPTGDNSYQLKSVTGNIRFIKME